MLLEGDLSLGLENMFEFKQEHVSLTLSATLLGTPVHLLDNSNI